MTLEATEQELRVLADALATMLDMWLVCGSGSLIKDITDADWEAAESLSIQIREAGPTQAMTIEEATAKTEPGALAGQQGLF